MKMSFAFRRCCLVVSAGFILLEPCALGQSGSANSVPLVRLELIDGEATETLIHQNHLDWAEFRVVRTGSPTNELRVFLATDGTARFQEDYKFDRVDDGLTVLFRTGESNINVRLYPIDDEQKETNENAIVRLSSPPYMGPLPDPYQIDSTRSRVEMIIHDNDPVIATVSMRTLRMPETTAEPCPTCLVAPGVIKISRWGSYAQPLPVYLKTDGTATPGIDYRALPEVVTIPAGSNATYVLVLPFDDLLVEGPEVVRARLAPDPDGAYVVARFENEALVVIRDDEPNAPDARLDIVEPHDNAQFPAGSTIELSAISVLINGEVSRPVEFYAGDRLIGESPPGPLRPAVPGMPNVHTIWWTNPPSGQHLITARVQISLDRWLTAPPISIIIGSEPPLPVVNIEATQPMAEESSYPLRRLPLRGELTISRTGPTDNPLPVFVHYQGTATPGKDYSLTPWFVTIPEGAASTRIEIVPVDDGVEEGIETVIATLSDCPPHTDPPLGMPCYGGFEIDPARNRATVLIADNAATRASLTITNPEDGANFDTGETILVEATAIDLDGHISRVEFWDGEARIGVSEVVFIREPDPGTPIHHTFQWRGAAAGRHLLTARAVRDDGTPVKSLPVHLTVGSDQFPRIAITRPVSGTEFPPDSTIEIIAETVDPDGYVPKVEFFADGRKIGEVNVVLFIRPPDPGQTQTFSFVWRLPAPGHHVLAAVATDDVGNRAASAAVEIKVGTSEPLPIVTVTAPDPFAVEPQSNADLNTATFRIRRHGATNDALVVAYTLRGTAENGVDYERLSGLATIPAGNRSAILTVRPLADSLREGIESVRLRLEEPPPPSPEVRVINPYRVGRRDTAAAAISDYPWFGRCRALPDGLVHLCFGAEIGGNFRIEATTDFRTWETLFATTCSESALHFIDTEAESQPQRFYRITSEPVIDVE